MVSCSLESAYLRDDVPCGSALCGLCRPTAASLATDAGAYVMPDADALSSFLELWELPELSNCVLLTSVVRQVGGGLQAQGLA